MGIMKVIAAALVASTTAVPLTWKDCGDASTHGHITDIAPLEIPIGATTNLVGKGSIDEDVNSATFTFVAKVGPVPILKGSGNVCEDNTIKLPLGAGSILVHGIDCPRAAGDVELKLDITALASAEAINGLVNIQLDASSDTGDKLLCAALTTTQKDDEVVEDDETLESSDKVICWNRSSSRSRGLSVCLKCCKDKGYFEPFQCQSRCESHCTDTQCGDSQEMTMQV